MDNNISDVPRKIRKLDSDFIDSSCISTTKASFHKSYDDLQNSHLVLNANESLKRSVTLYQNNKCFSRFFERLKLKTIPLVSPLLERLAQAERNNKSVLSSIDQIQKRITVIELQAIRKKKRNRKKNLPDRTDNSVDNSNTDEYKRMMASISNSPVDGGTKTSLSSPPFRTMNGENEGSQSIFNTFTNVLREPFPSQNQNSEKLNQNNSVIDLTFDDQNRKPSLNPIIDQHRSPNKSIDTVYANKIVCHNVSHRNGTVVSTSPLSTLSSTSSSSSPYLSIVTLSSLYLPREDLCHPPSGLAALLSAPKLAWTSVKGGICLQWDMVATETNLKPTTYQIYSFQRPNVSAVQNSFPWKKIGEVDALPLPMACTLTQVVKECNYFFAVRASIQNQTFSPWSNVALAEIH